MPRAVTPEYLYKSALHYLERYAASAQGVRTVLQRRLKNRARRGEDIPQAAPQWIDQVITKLQQAGYLNDLSFAETKLVALRRAGASTRTISQKLALKGVAKDTIAHVLATDDSSDAKAAHAYARRRRLGPYAAAATRADKRDKHIAALARAGFSLTLARQIITSDGKDDGDDDSA